VEISAPEFVCLTKILIVDDSPAEVRLMQSILDRAGFSCIAVHDPTRLEQIIDAEKPNLILLDVVMPQRNGFQACRELKGNAEYAKIPVVIISSKGTESDRFWGKEQGADGYMVKPFTNEVLLRTVRNLVKKK
jgi:twitching motility two-component system response regulator PilH